MEFLIPDLRLEICVRPKCEASGQSFPFVANISCLYHVYVRGEAYLAAGQGRAAAEFQKILDHSGIVWNCWTGALARLGVARANALQARTFQGQGQGADADAASVRALAAYKDFLALWKDAVPDIPILKGAKAECAKLQKLIFSVQRPRVNSGRGRPEWDLRYEEGDFTAVRGNMQEVHRGFCL